MEVDRGKSKLTELIQDVHAACGHGLYQTCLSRRSLACCFLPPLGGEPCSVLDKRVLALLERPTKSTTEAPAADEELHLDLSEPLAVIKETEPVLYQAISGFLRKSKAKGHATKDELLFLELLVLLKASLMLPTNERLPHPQEHALDARVEAALAALKTRTPVDLPDMVARARLEIHNENHAHQQLQWVHLNASAVSLVKIDRTTNTVQATLSPASCSTLAAVARVVAVGCFAFEVSLTTPTRGVRVGWMAPHRLCHATVLGDDPLSFGFDGCNVYHDGTIVATVASVDEAVAVPLHCSIDLNAGNLVFAATATVAVPHETSWVPAMSLGHRSFASIASTHRSTLYPSVWSELGFHRPLATAEAGVPLLPAPMVDFYPDTGTSTRLGTSVKLSPSAWTLSFFVYPLASQDTSEPRPWRTICLKGQDAAMQRTPSVFLSCDRLLLAVCVSTTSDWNSTVVSSAPVATNRWTHVAVVCDGLSLRLVLNGKEDRSITLGDRVVHNDYPFHFGKTPRGVKKATTDYKGFRGYLHDVVLHEAKALSVKDISKYIHGKKSSLDALHVLRDGLPATALPSGRETFVVTTRWGADTAARPAVAFAPATGGAMTVSPAVFLACPKWPYAFHCEAVVRLTRSAKLQVVLGAFQGAAYAFIFGVTPCGRLTFRTKERKFSTARAYVGEGCWHRVGFSFTLERVVFYVDGVAVERGASSSATIDPNGLAATLSFVVGGAPDVASMSPWQGAVTLVRLLHAPPLDMTEQEVARWTFTEGQGTVAYDSSATFPRWHGVVGDARGWTLVGTDATPPVVSGDPVAIAAPTGLVDRLLGALAPLATTAIESLAIKQRKPALALVKVASPVVFPHVLTFLLLHSMLKQWAADKDALDAPQVQALLRVLRANFGPLSAAVGTSMGLPPASVGLGMAPASFAARLADLLLALATIEWFDEETNERVRADAVATYVAGLEVFAPSPATRAELIVRLVHTDGSRPVLAAVCRAIAGAPPLLAQLLPAATVSTTTQLPWTPEQVKAALLGDGAPPSKTDVVHVLEKLPRTPMLDGSSPEQLLVLYQEWYAHHAMSHAPVPLETTKQLLKGLVGFVAHSPDADILALVAAMQASLVRELYAHWSPSDVARVGQWHYPPRTFKVVNCPIGVREAPSLKAPKTGRTLSIGQVIASHNVLQHAHESVRYVELPGGGWAFDVDPTDGMLLLDEHGGGDATPPPTGYSLRTQLQGYDDGDHAPTSGFQRFENTTNGLVLSDDGCTVKAAAGGEWRNAFGTKAFEQGTSSGLYSWQISVERCHNIGQLVLGVCALSGRHALSHAGADASSYGWLLTGDAYHGGVCTKSGALPLSLNAPVCLAFQVDTAVGTLVVSNAETGGPCGPPLAVDLAAGEAYVPVVSLCNDGDIVRICSAPTRVVATAVGAEPPALEPTALATFYAKVLLPTCKNTAVRRVLAPLLTSLAAAMCCWSSVDDESFFLDTIDDVLLGASVTDDDDALLALGSLSGHLYGQLIGAAASTDTTIEEAEVRWLQSPLFASGLRPKTPSACPSTFYKQLADGSLASFDKWVLKYANASPLVVRMGGASLDKAVRAVLGCMLYHTGMSSYAEFEDKASAGKTGPAPKPLRMLWQKAYELKAWALRLKNTACLSYDAIAGALLSKVEFLMALAPCKADDGIGVYYHELPTLVRKISMGTRSNSFDLEDLDKNVALLDADADILAAITGFCRAECNLNKLGDHLQSVQHKAQQRALGLRRVTTLLQSVPTPIKAAVLLHVVAAVRSVDAGLWHYNVGLSGCPLALKADVRAAFDGYYNCLVRHLSLAPDAPSWQLLLLDAIAVRILPDDHALVAAGRVFHVLQELLDLCHSEVRQATMQVVYLLAVQVASEGDHDDKPRLHALTPPHFKRQLSGPQTLSTAVFDMLYNELSSVVWSRLDAAKTPANAYRVDAVGDNTSVRGILSLLQFVSCSSVCQTSLSTTAWLSMFVTIACFGHVEPQVRAMQLLATLLPLSSPIVVTLDLPFTLDALQSTPSAVVGATPLVHFFLHAVGAVSRPIPGPTLPRSARTAFSLASESVSLLRKLAHNVLWQPLVLDILEAQFRGGKPVAQAGVLGVLGAFIEPIRYGGFVQLADQSVAMLVDPACDVASSNLLVEGREEPVAVADVTMMPKHTLPLTVLPPSLVDAVLEHTATVLLAPTEASKAPDLFLGLVQVAHRIFCESPSLLFDVVAKSPAIARKVFELGGHLSASSGLPSLHLVEDKYDMLQTLLYTQVYAAARDALYPMLPTPTASHKEHSPPPATPPEPPARVCNITFEEGLLCTLKQVSTYETPVGIAADAVRWLEALLNHMLFKTVQRLVAAWQDPAAGAAAPSDVQRAVEAVYKAIALPEMLQAACAEAAEWLTNREHWGVEWNLHEARIVDYVVGRLEVSAPGIGWRERCATLLVGPYLCATCECLAADVLSLAMEVSRRDDRQPPVISLACVLQAMQDDEELHRLLEYHEAFMRAPAVEEKTEQTSAKRVLDAHLESMMTMGFPEAWCRRALLESQYDVSAALNWILSNGHLLEAPMTPLADVPTGAPDDVPELDQTALSPPAPLPPANVVSTASTYDAGSDDGQFTTFWAITGPPAENPTVMFRVQTSGEACVGLFATPDVLGFEVVVGSKHNSHCEVFHHVDGDKRLVASDTGAFCDDSVAIPYWLVITTARVYFGHGATPTPETIVLDWATNGAAFTHVSFATRAPPAVFSAISVATNLGFVATSWHQAALERRSCLRPLDDPDQMSDMAFCFYDASSPAMYQREDVFHGWAPAASRLGFVERAAKLSREELTSEVADTAMTLRVLYARRLGVGVLACCRADIPVLLDVFASHEHLFVPFVSLVSNRGWVSDFADAVPRLLPLDLARPTTPELLRPTLRALCRTQNPLRAVITTYVREQMNRFLADGSPASFSWRKDHSDKLDASLRRDADLRFLLLVTGWVIDGTDGADDSPLAPSAIEYELFFVWVKALQSTHLDVQQKALQVLSTILHRALRHPENTAVLTTLRDAFSVPMLEATAARLLAFEEEVYPLYSRYFQAHVDLLAVLARLPSAAMPRDVRFALRFKGSCSYVAMASDDVLPPWTAVVSVRPEAGSVKAVLASSSFGCIQLRGGDVGLVSYKDPSTVHTFAASVPMHAWSVLAIVATPTEVAVYVNGAVVGTRPVIGFQLPMQFLGHDHLAFRGCIANVRYFHAALAPTHIATLSALDRHHCDGGPLPPMQPLDLLPALTTVGHWPLQEGAGSHVYDVAGHYTESAVVGATWIVTLSPTSTPPHTLAPPTEHIVFAGAGTWTRHACAALGGPWGQPRCMAFQLTLFATSAIGAPTVAVMGRLVLDGRIACIVAGSATSDGTVAFAITSIKQDIKEAFHPMEWMQHLRFTGGHRGGHLAGAWTTTLPQTVVATLPWPMSFLPSFSDAVEGFDGGRRVQSLLRKGKKRASTVLCSFGTAAIAAQWASRPAPDLPLADQLHVSNRTDTFVTVRVHGLVTRGKVYYELVLQSKGLMQLGWAGPAFRPAFTTHGVGDHFGSFGIDGKRRKKWCNTGHTYGHESWAWSTGDVIGVLLDMDAREMRFTHQGVDLGVAFTESDYPQVAWDAGLYPAGSFSNGQGATFNVGATPFQFPPPPGYVAVATVTSITHVDVFNHRTKQFVPVCAHHRISLAVPRPLVSITRGSYLWEMEISALQSTDGIRLGIATPSADPTLLLGNDAFGWALCASGKTYHNGNSHRFASTGFAQGDVVGLELNMESGALYVYRNDVLLGAAFQNLHLELPMQTFVTSEGGFIPAVSLYRPQSCVHVRGLKHGRSTMQYPPQHVNERFTGEWVHGRREGLGQLSLRGKEGYYLGRWANNALEGAPAWIEPSPLCVPTLYPGVWHALRFQRSRAHPTVASRTKLFCKGKHVGTPSDADLADELPTALPPVVTAAAPTAPWYPSVHAALGFVTARVDSSVATTGSVALDGVWQAHAAQPFTLIPTPPAYESIVVAPDLTSVRLGPNASAGSHLLLRANTSFTSGVHYWEVTIEACNHGSVFLGVVAPSAYGTPAPDGWGDYGFVSYRVKWSQNEGEQLYGRYFSAGDTIGIRLDMDRGTLAFLKDGDDFVRGRPAVVDMGIAFRFLRSQSSRKVCAFSPAFGLSYPGDALSVRGAKSVHWPTLPLEARMAQAVIAANIVQDLHRAQAYPASLLAAAEGLHSAAVATDAFQPAVYTTRGGTPVRFTEAMHTAALATTRGQASIATRHGVAVVLGQIGDQVWYIIEGEEAAGAWYWTVHDAVKLLDAGPMVEEPAWSCDACTMLNEPNLSKCQICETPKAVVELPPPVDEDDVNSGPTEPFTPTSVAPEGLWPLATPTPGVSDAYRLLATPPADWTVAQDQALVAQVDALCDELGQDPENVRWSVIWSSVGGSLSNFAPSFVAARWACLLVLNATVAQLLPYVDLHSDGLFEVPVAATAVALTGLRDVLFKRTKIAFWRQLLDVTTTHTTPPSDEYDRPDGLREVSLNRIQALEPNCAVEKTIFGQLMAAMTNWDAATLRRAYTDELQDAGQPRAFYVKCLGEGVDDHGGPYRAVFQTAGWEEPIGPSLQLFVPCPNALNAEGANQDKYVLSASAPAGHLRFLGQLMGLAMRHRILIPLNCSELLWKPLVGLPVDRKDWSGVDTTVVRELHNLECLGDDKVAALERRDVLEHLLRMAQAPVPVTTADADTTPLTAAAIGRMVDACVAYRLDSQLKRLRPLMEGLATVVPHAALSLFTPAQLEELVCGSPEIDVDLLQRITVYEGVDPQEPHIQFFWECLSDMNHEQRSSFVNFVLARSRLPRSMEEFTLHFKIQPAMCAENTSPDIYLPHSQTCFFSLSLPRYSSKAICMEKLLYAIDHSPTMDADFVERGSAGWEHVAT
ncbi:HECT E3 ubiquitin ligase [Achlya hypogyna]|uniref:HECT E3 ubiquitin ligase n=1 Tax=Achlya hypogyna TaxID=1202772 RepID=A0A1V9Z9X1_ACHHY|nr:HECT E3 ubiquitin ligase [Achlya hypogyna]